MKNTKSSPWNALLTLIIYSASSPLLAAETQLPTTDFPESMVTSNSPTGISSAWYDGATARYSHGVLGDAIEATELHTKLPSGQQISLILDSQHVFEDIAPRLADMDGDEQNEIITIRSHQNKGAQIAVYGITKAQPNHLSLVASTPYIGKPYRWLAPIGIADFNNDGAMDIAYIDRPHLAKLLRIWSYTPAGLQQIAQKSGLTNHRIGDDFITGGVQVCEEKSSMITVNTDWSRMIKTYFKMGRLISEDIGAFVNTASADAALKCG